VTKEKKPPKDALESYTGRDRRWWLRFVQRRIAKCSGPVQSDGHSRMTSYNWLGDVIVELVKTLPKDGPAYDPNMRLAYLTAMVLGTWYSRVHHSKTFDPRRPKKIRRKAYESWRNAVLGLVGSLISEHDDPLVFNGKPYYENPYDPKATSGKFV
jgi:hypothetical protein